MPVTDGLILHLDADTLALADGEPVTSWASTTDAALVAAQSTAVNQPVLAADAMNGNNVVRFDGVDDRLLLSENLFSAASLPRTLFTVLQTDDYQGHVIGTGDSTPGNLTTNGFGLGLSANKPFLKALTDSNGVWVLSPENVSGAGAQIVAGSVANGETQLRTACNVVSTAAEPMPPAIAMTQIGGTVDGVQAFAGSIAEILVYDRVLTAAEKTDVLQYLGGRYAAPVAQGVDTDSDGIFDECDNGAVYLKHPEITVELISPTELSGGVILNAINAESATAFDPHTRLSHVEAAGSRRIEILIDLQSVYRIETVHFWNYLDENFDFNEEVYNWDVDEITLTFYDSANTVLDQVELVPQPGYEDILPEDFDVDVPGVRYIRAELRGDNGNTEFQNIGFTGVPEGM